VNDVRRVNDASRVLVIGYGNALRTDDGVGPAVAELLAADPRLAGAKVLALHQLAPELAADLGAARLAILVDASTFPPPGAVTVRQLQPGDDDEAGRGGGATSHHVDPGALLALARELYGAAPDAFVVSVGVVNLEPGEGLSPLVAAALPRAVEAAVRLLSLPMHVSRDQSEAATSRETSPGTPG
jgi:hydrogenase maturation protease